METTWGQGIVFTTKQHVGNAANQNSRLTCSLQARRSLHKLERTPCKQVPSSPYIRISGTDSPCVMYPAARHARCTQPAHVVPTIFAQREQHTPAMKQRATTAQHQILSRTALWQYDKVRPTHVSFWFRLQQILPSRSVCSTPAASLASCASAHARSARSTNFFHSLTDIFDR